MKSFARVFFMEFALLVFLGLLVSVILQPVLELDVVQQVDLTIGDRLMRGLAREHVAQPGANALRFVFVSVGKRSCMDWARGAACSASFTIPRDRLADIANEINSFIQRDSGSGKPKLVAFDIELAPLPPPSNTADASLCSALARLSRQVPLEGVRPLVVEAGVNGPEIRTLPSILDPAINGDQNCEGEKSTSIWLGSSLVHADADGAVRSVDKWDMARTDDGRIVAVPSIGFLGAALLHAAPSASGDCVFRPLQTTPCLPHDLWVGSEKYEFPREQREPDRILFTVPYGISGERGIENYGYTPSVMESIEAVDLPDRLASDPHLLKDAVVLVGDSYPASGDLYRTPLNNQFPGAMIHANAINAYATKNGVIKQSHSWLIEMLLVACAAGTSALSHALGQRYVERLLWPGNALLETLIAILGTVAAICVVFLVCYHYAYNQLETGGALIGTVTPALCVALEGFSTFLHHIRQLIHSAGQHPFTALKKSVPPPGGH